MGCSLLYKPNIITLSETWLNSNIPSNYTLYRSDRSSRDGGVAIYVSSEFISELTIPAVVPLYFECVFVKVIFHENKSLIIGSIYRPPSSPAETFDHLISTINSISCKNKIILLGDFNKTWLSHLIK